MTAAIGAGAKPLPRRIGAAHSDQARSRMRPAPLCGSAILSTMPMQPATRAAWAATFPVELASPGKARATTRWFLGNCPVAQEVTDTAEFVTSELVANAVKAMQVKAVDGPCVEVSWRMFAQRLLIEVTDSSPLPPIQRNLDAKSEDGRGLAAVDGLTADWGFFWHRGLKVVFAVLEPIDMPNASCDHPRMVTVCSLCGVAEENVAKMTGCSHPSRETKCVLCSSK
jgi:anti-sigma regulatory factor (Ser/Thr protein kinase)